MSLGIPISIVKKEGHDLILYSNPSYGYYIKKFNYKTKLSSKLSPLYKDYDIAVNEFNKLVEERNNMIVKIAYCGCCGNENLYKDESTGKIYCNNCNEFIGHSSIMYRYMKDTEQIVYKPKTK